MIGIDPAVTLTYRDEYVRTVGQPARGFRVHLIQEWLSQHLPSIEQVLAHRGGTPSLADDTNSYILMGHCTEQTLEPASQAQWREAFTAFGLGLELAVVGCCGMCGMYGHEAVHYAESKGIYGMSWQRHLPQTNAANRVLATGHSCRSQVKRFEGFVPLHPVEALLRALESRSPS
jgi:Fe-S oxidoreductase